MDILPTYLKLLFLNDMTKHVKAVHSTVQQP